MDKTIWNIFIWNTKQYPVIYTKVCTFLSLLYPFLQSIYPTKYIYILPYIYINNNINLLRFKKLRFKKFKKPVQSVIYLQGQSRVNFIYYYFELVPIIMSVNFLKVPHLYEDHSRNDITYYYCDLGITIFFI